MWCVCAVRINHVKRTQNETFTSFTFVSQGAFTGDSFPYYSLSLIFFSSEARTGGLCNCLLKISNRLFVTSQASLVLPPLTRRPGKLWMFVPPKPSFSGVSERQMSPRVLGVHHGHLTLQRSPGPGPSSQEATKNPRPHWRPGSP